MRTCRCATAASPSTARSGAGRGRYVATWGSDPAPGVRSIGQLVQTRLLASGQAAIVNGYARSGGMDVRPSGRRLVSPCLSMQGAAGTQDEQPRDDELAREARRVVRPPGRPGRRRAPGAPGILPPLPTDPPGPVRVTATARRPPPRPGDERAPDRPAPPPRPRATKDRPR